MITPEVKAQYTATIGIECHVQLRTKTKLFAAVGNDAREAPPNSLVSHICFGLPGALPVLNEAALQLAMRAAFALGTEPQKYSKFDRKHYFYPDLPKGYQITQFAAPIIEHGSLTITVDGERKEIGITRAHLEEDAGKSTHPAGKAYSLVDLNRAGTPLLEIVSEPELHTPAEAKAYARELYLRMKFADVSDANLYYGNMRFDINVSVSKTSEWGNRTETKNINSFRAVEKVVEYEIQRQIEELEAGRVIVQETRGWDDAKQKTFSQRTKEDAHDYRYFPDPDIPPVVLEDEAIARVKADMPPMPDEWRARLQAAHVDEAQMETLLDAEADSDDRGYLALIEQQLDDAAFAKTLANWLVNIELPYVREQNDAPAMSDTARADLYSAVYGLSQAGQLSSTNVKQLILAVLQDGVLPDDMTAYATDKGFIQVSDEAAIEEIVRQVVADNTKAADDIRAGEMKAIGFLVGQVMKASQGKANPALAQQLIKKVLGV